jgi:predicted ATP-grasp superfamily ATP-dependent carboligase
VLLGVSEQLAGRRALGVRGFTWCGNVAPPRLPSSQQGALATEARAICDHVAAAFGLHGLFGVDLVWDGERAWVVEVNPRPTASLEVIDAVHRVRPFTAHVDACAGRLPAEPARADGASPGTAAAGKAVVWATRDVCLPDTRDWPARGIRDVPHAGERIAAGRPICTLVASGETPEAVLAGLEARAGALRTELHEAMAVDGVA